MDRDPSLAEFTAAVRRPDPEIPLARAALLIAAAEQPGLDVDGYLGRLNGLADAAEPARRASASSRSSLASTSRVGYSLLAMMRAARASSICPSGRETAAANSRAAGSTSINSRGRGECPRS